MSIENTGLFELDKGNVRKDIRLFAWDSIRECNPASCSVSNICTYIKQGKCAVLIQYTKVLYDSILANYTSLDQLSLFKIGMHIVPLYLQLARLQMVEMGLVTPEVLDDKGKVSIHPAYREIRSTLTTINLMWKDLEMTFVSPLKPDPIGEVVDKPDSVNGNPGYYERMTANNKPQKGVIR